MSAKSTVVIAMSGGVDSSVAAGLLTQEGFRVIGMMLRLWSEPGKQVHNRCCTPDAMHHARRVAAHFDFPFYVVDVRERFRESVVQYFIDGYAAGLTPNPCLICNRLIRWRFLLQHARALGADFMATGHYARVHQSSDGRTYQLLRAVDRQKDQSYILSALNQEQLSQALFPLGKRHKSEVRDLARGFGLPVADRPDSQDLCFVADGDYRDFLKRQAPELVAPGPIYNTRGEILGEHGGLAFFTIGQRKGLGVTGPDPHYVLQKDVSGNALVVGRRDELGSQEFLVAEVNWIAGTPPTEPLRARIQTRYKTPEVGGVLHPLAESRVHVRLENAVPDVTPGQVSVFYQDDTVLGGGIIQPRQRSATMD